MSRARRRRQFLEADNYWARCAKLTDRHHVQPKVWQRRRWRLQGIRFKRLPGEFVASYSGLMWDTWISD